jgi:hypothetical protein
MSNNRVNTEVIEQFFDGYFNQHWKDVLDWHGNTPNFAEVVRLFKTHSKECNEDIVDLHFNLRNLLTGASEEEIERFIVKTGMPIDIPAYGLTYHQWINDLIKVLEEPGRETYLTYK